MACSDDEIIFLIRQFLEEKNFKDTRLKLELESLVFFNLNHLEDEILKGNWDAVEEYLFRFTTPHANQSSIDIFTAIRRQKYLEALYEQDRAKALDILMKDLKVFQTLDGKLHEQLVQLLTIDNLRQHTHISQFGDTRSTRMRLVATLKPLIQANPLIRNKLQLPALNTSLHTLINRSLSSRPFSGPSPLPSGQWMTNPAYYPESTTHWVRYPAGYALAPTQQLALATPHAGHPSHTYCVSERTRLGGPSNELLHTTVRPMTHPGQSQSQPLTIPPDDLVNIAVGRPKKSARLNDGATNLDHKQPKRTEKGKSGKDPPGQPHS